VNVNDEINQRRIAYLYEAVICGSVRAAADKLNLNPSAVSRQISLLEAAVGGPLLERHSKGVKPTETGQLMLDYYRTFLAMAEDLREKLRETRGLERGHIKLAVGDGFISDLMSGPLQAFHKSHQGITLDVQTGGTAETIRHVSEDAAHIGMVYNPSSDSRIRSRISAVRPLCAIVRAGHPLSNLPKPPDITQVSSWPVVMKPLSFGTMQLIDIEIGRAHV